jgi:predicted DNA-binding protein YlxM (UPF0122 family)
MEEYRSGKYSDSELMGRYHMSKDAFYNSVEELKKKQAKFEADMEVSGKNLKPEKLKRLKKEMRRSLKGCRKIACDFNTEMSMNGEEIRKSNIRW